MRFPALWADDTARRVELVTRMVLDALEKQTKKTNDERVQNSAPAARVSVPVGVSARHIHLSQADVRRLFGEGHTLTRRLTLMGGQYAADETVTLVGLKLRAIENVRVLGPERERTQVEISATDAVRLGISAPLRDSGDIKGSAAVAVVGPKGAVYLQEGCIVAARHIHMPPGDAAAAGLRDGDTVSVRVDSPRGVVLDKVKVRVDASYTLEMHIDTDEANACQLKTGDRVVIAVNGGAAV